MSTKINVPLFIFAIMIQCIFVGILTIMPASITSAMPGFSNPMAYMLGITPPDTNFGMAMSSLSGDHTYACETGYLECIAFVFEMIWAFIVVVFSFLWMAGSVAIYIAVILFSLIMFFITSVVASLYVFSGFPSFISIPLSLLILAANLIVVIDIALVAKGLIENIY